MRLYLMFVTAVCVLFLIKIKYSPQWVAFFRGMPVAYHGKKRVDL